MTPYCHVTGHGLGYARHVENFARLYASQRGFSSAFLSAEIPDKIDLTSGKIPVKNQGSVGACTGFSRAVGEEILNLLATGKYIELSPQYAYVENQIAAGMLGSDQGATIDASVRAAAATGICTEAACPWPGRYSTALSIGAEAEGKLHLIRGHAVMHEVADVRSWLGNRQGPILIGVTWTEGMSASTGLIASISGRPIGGHALVFTGYDATTITMRNSWGERWGDAGNARVADRVVEQWLRQGEAIIGITDFDFWGPRKINKWEGIV